jgi:putative ABC transport system permease protein
MDTVLGSNVADKTVLAISDNFVGVHGFVKQGHSHYEFKYTVTGILKPTGTVIDNLVLTPIERFGWHLLSSIIMLKRQMGTSFML